MQRVNLWSNLLNPQKPMELWLSTQNMRPEKPQPIPSHPNLHSRHRGGWRCLVGSRNEIGSHRSHVVEVHSGHLTGITVFAVQKIWTGSSWANYMTSKDDWYSFFTIEYVKHLYNLSKIFQDFSMIFLKSCDDFWKSPDFLSTSGWL